MEASYVRKELCSSSSNTIYPFVMRKTNFGIVATFLAVFTSCNSTGDLGSTGAFMQSSFAPDCPSSDLACTSYGLNVPLSTGGYLPLTIDVDSVGSSGAPMILESVNPEVIEIGDDFSIRGKKAGISAILLSYTDSTVYDLLHIWVADPTDIFFRKQSEEGYDLGSLASAFQMVNGDRIFVSIEVFSNGQPLVGFTDGEWTVDDPNVVQIYDDGITGRRGILAVSKGKAKVTFTSNTLTPSLEIEVL